MTIVEIFSGSGRLLLTAKELGCRVDPVDHRSNRHRQHVRATNFDLSQPCAMQELIVLLRRHRGRVHEEGGGLHVHFAPPCGTCSRAREVPLPRGQRGPVPLRSAQYPTGLPTLTGTDRDKVAAANALYDLVSNVIMQHLAHWPAVTWSIENPTNSWMWWLVPIAKLLNLPTVLDADVTACNYGSTWDKKTRFRCNIPAFASMAGP